MSSQLPTTARIAFIQDSPAFLTERPYLYVLPAPSDVPLTNCTFSSKTPTALIDCRETSYENDFEKRGFAFLHSPLAQADLASSQGRDVPSDDLLDYLRSIQELTRDYTGAEQTIVFDWRFRRSAMTDNIEGVEPDSVARGQFTRPAYKAHADLSPAGGWMTLKAYLSKDEYASVKSADLRASVVTCWRSLLPVVEDCPLAFCARQTVSKEDCVPFDRVDGSASDSQGMFLKQDPSQSWYWLPRQTRDEVSIFESWDSLKKGYDAHTFHAAFRASKDIEICRMSIEVRMIILRRNK
ncbi:hypothetical protein F5Y16DRAFT_406648 [Xylariaceae sp. FL0255]|nr:hypothetical protein F5Y16DRAFT_406648 [Xylariaceae sp. FL0255]